MSEVELNGVDRSAEEKRRTEINSNAAANTVKNNVVSSLVSGNLDKAIKALDTSTEVMFTASLYQPNKISLQRLANNLNSMKAHSSNNAVQLAVQGLQDISTDMNLNDINNMIEESMKDNGINVNNNNPNVAKSNKSSDPNAGNKVIV